MLPTTFRPTFALPRLFRIGRENAGLLNSIPISPIPDITHLPPQSPLHRTITLGSSVLIPAEASDHPTLRGRFALLAFVTALTGGLFYLHRNRSAEGWIPRAYASPIPFGLGADNLPMIAQKDEIHHNLPLKALQETAVKYVNNGNIGAIKHLANLCENNYFDLRKSLYTAITLAAALRDKNEIGLLREILTASTHKQEWFLYSLYDHALWNERPDLIRLYHQCGIYPDLSQHGICNHDYNRNYDMLKRIVHLAHQFPDKGIIEFIYHVNKENIDGSFSMLERAIDKNDLNEIRWLVETFPEIRLENGLNYARRTNNRPLIAEFLREQCEKRKA